MSTIANYDKLAEALDALQSATTEGEKDRLFAIMVDRAVACDPMALRAPSISEWCEKRVSVYRQQTRRGFP